MKKKMCMTMVVLLFGMCGMIHAATNKTLSENLTVQGNLTLESSGTGVTPTAASHITIKSYVDTLSAAQLVWKGYTGSAYDGARTGISGMNTLCNSAYAGSHACTFEEIIRLGTSYPYSSNAWVVDGSYLSSYGTTNAVGYQVTVDGAAYDNSYVPYYPMCRGWTTNSSSYRGPIVQTTGSMALGACNSAYYIPCCD